jgi:hypothetical protein
MSSNLPTLPADYADWLTALKRRIQGARQRAVLAANAEQVRLYHDIGREILSAAVSRAGVPRSSTTSPLTCAPPSRI